MPLSFHYPVSHALGPKPKFFISTDACVLILQAFQLLSTLDDRNTANLKLGRQGALAICFQESAKLSFLPLPNVVSKVFSRCSEKVGGRLSSSLLCGVSMTCASRDDTVLGFAGLR
ncbi:hypothetical protein GMOD_00002036 [Pyrenophora seminiperda CCB06]|uniref:Uncharacterized protein n=1 Tax=Pyrenophora seminiperda CCB06 TaxID=1302712 RepID=A0A3M7LWQ2_9PLEO|nr:hypothetical protein GMOD_00002036 [Pyrenophora seminiperda CCB06]